MTQCGPASPHSVEIHHGVASLGVHQSQVVENNVKKVILVIFDGHLEAVVGRVENISLCLRVKYSDGRSAFDLEMINCGLWSLERRNNLTWYLSHDWSAQLMAAILTIGDQASTSSARDFQMGANL